MIVVMKQSIGELPPRGESVWYMIKDGAHEGPYAMLQLEARSRQGEVDQESLIWAKGWPQPLAFHVVHAAYQEQVVTTPPKSEPQLMADQEGPALAEPSGTSSRWWVMASLLIFIAIIWAAGSMLRAPVVITRPAELPLDKFRQVQTQFERFVEAVPLPFVVVSADYSKVWAVDRSTQSCSYQANFFSSETQNLSGEVISWQAQSVSANHWVLFERLNFIDGQKVFPGRYKMTLSRQNCTPTGVLSFWQAPDQDVSVSVEVDLFNGAPEELGRRLEALAKKKSLDLKKLEQTNRQAWRDIEEKFRTLDAITVQVLQNFQSLLKRDLPWPQRLKRVVDLYTVRFGGFLSNFIIQNDADFSHLATQDLPQKVDVLGRQALINTFAKRIGFVSMSFIERLQKDSSTPNRRDLEDWFRVMEQDMGVEREKLKQAVIDAQELSTKALDVQ